MGKAKVVFEFYAIKFEIEKGTELNSDGRSLAFIISPRLESLREFPSNYPHSPLQNVLLRKDCNSMLERDYELILANEVFLMKHFVSQ